MLWSRLGKGIDKTLVGKDLGLCQVVHAVDYQKNHIFAFKFPDLVCLCMLMRGENLATIFSVLKRKKIQFVSTHSPSGFGLAPAIFGKILMQASVENECTSLFCQEVLLSGVDNASGQYLDYATLKLC